MLWNPPAVAVVMIVYAVAVNAPFIAIQRYNRLHVAARSRPHQQVVGVGQRRGRRSAALTIVAPHQRKEHPVRLTAVDVVGAVGVTQPAEVGDIGNSHGEAPVDEQLVDGQVGDAIGGDPSGGPPRPSSAAHRKPPGQHARSRAPRSRAGTDRCVPTCPAGRVVAGVPRHPRTVHHPAVQRVAHRFHARRRRRGSATIELIRVPPRRRRSAGSFPAQQHEGQHGEGVGELLPEDVPHRPPAADIAGARSTRSAPTTWSASRRPGS